MFNGLTRDELLELSPFMYERNYAIGEVVFFRSDASQAIYLVKSGSVDLSLDIGEEKDEKLFTCHSNYSLGINSILADQKRDFNAVVCSEKSTLIAIPQSDLFDLFKRRKSIKIKILENFADIYEQMFSKIFKIYRNNVGFFDLRKIFEE